GEYNVDIQFDTMPHQHARWIETDNPEEKVDSVRNMLVYDQLKRPVLLFQNDFALRWFKDKNPDIPLRESR
ncbi:MAG: peptide chain release factor 3, partial [Anaerobacillus sp.]